MKKIFDLVQSQNESRSPINKINLKETVSVDRKDKLIEFINGKDRKPTQTYVVVWQDKEALWATVLTIGYDKEHVVLRNPENIWDARYLMMGSFLDLTFEKVENNPLLCFCEEI